jgi:hypothetical protein
MALATMFVIRNGMTERWGREEWELQFSREIAQPGEAMELPGFDTSQPLIAPVRWNDEDEH